MTTSGSTRLDSGQIKIPYGRDSDGLMRHVSEVAAGLRCGCVCAKCNQPLVAYKGRRKQHHFGHHVTRACAGALETALHKFAKQVLSKHRAVYLPPRIARAGTAQQVLGGAQEFRYEAVDEELVMAGMRPDIVVRRGDAALVVEIAVRHPCEETKLAHIRRQRIPAMEIDLSRVPHDASPEEHADAILRSAPRYWLFNRHIDDAETKLRRQADAAVAARKLRDDEQWESLARHLTIAYQAETEDGGLEWVAAVQEAGLASLIGTTCRGDACFRVPTHVWQAAIIGKFLLGHELYVAFPLTSVIKWLSEQDVLKAPFATLPIVMADDQRSYLCSVVPDFRTPADVVEDFLMVLAHGGLIRRGRRRWSVETSATYAARNRQAAAERARNRVAELAAAIDAIKEVAILGDSIEFARWMAHHHDGMSETPSQIAIVGGAPFEQLKQQLRTILKTLRPNGYPASGGLLGLPLDEDQAARRSEQREREEAWRLAREERERVSAARRRTETRSFVKDVLNQAREIFGDDAGAEWVASRLPPESGKENFELSDDRMRSLRSYLDTDRYQLAAAEAAQAAALAQAERSRAILKMEAARDPELSSPEKLALWLNASQPRLSGGRPREFCVDQATLNQCLSLLPSRLAKARRGTRR